MKLHFENQDIEDLILRHKSDFKLYKKLLKVKEFVNDLDKAIFILRNAPDAASLSNFGKLRYEKLKHNLSGLSSIRIGFSTKYRLLFRELDGGIEVVLIEINEHYGDK